MNSASGRWTLKKASQNIEGNNYTGDASIMFRNKKNNLLYFLFFYARTIRVQQHTARKFFPFGNIKTSAETNNRTGTRYDTTEPLGYCIWLDRRVC
jgi:hypothetical protein